jgi:hypothetical protein
MIYEAVCRTCGETFNPHDEDDLVHLQRNDGEPCGGQGDLMGYWIQNPKRVARPRS